MALIEVRVGTEHLPMGALVLFGYDLHLERGGQQGCSHLTPRSYIIAARQG